MQEEVNNGAAQVVVKVGKLSGRLLKAAVAKVLKAWQEKSDPQKLHRGKQTVKQLAAQNKGMSSIDVDKAGIRSFERVARKYGVNVNDAAAVQQVVKRLQEERARWKNFAVHPDLLKEANDAVMAEMGLKSREELSSAIMKQIGVESSTHLSELVVGALIQLGKMAADERGGWMAERITAARTQLEEVKGQNRPSRDLVSHLENSVRAFELIAEKVHTITAGNDLRMFAEDVSRMLDDFMNRGNTHFSLAGENEALLAPNGKPSNLAPEQYRQVRTPEFKKWFGDWEKVATFKDAYERIMAMPPVTALTGQEFQKDGVPLTEKVTKLWKEQFNGIAISPELGKVRLDLEGVKSSIGHGIGSLKSAAFACVEDVIRNGIVFDRQENWKGRGYDTAVIAAPVTIKDLEYICEVVVEQRSNRQGFYLHEVEIKKKLEDVFKTSTEGGTPQASRSILALRAEDVKREEENVSKVVDENGEPKVVYHNSGKRRRVLSREFSRKSMDIESVCFAPHADPYKEYGPYEHAVFLKIVAPADYKTAYVEPGIRLGATDDAGVKIREWLQSRGYDGVIEEEDGNVFEYKVFDPTQIKSSTDNRGTYDPNNPDITFSIASAQEQGLFKSGHFEAGNAVITEPGVTFSITALHASPHSFRKFTTEEIGNGEGAQTYGWGLYFAENQEVNKAYMNQFAQYVATWRFKDLETSNVDDMARGLRDRIKLPENVSRVVMDGALDTVYAVLGNLSDARGDKKKIDAIKDKLREDIRVNENYTKNYPDTKNLNDAENVVCQFLVDHLDEIEVAAGSPSNYRVELNVDEGSLLGWEYMERDVEELLSSSPVDSVRYAVEYARDVAGSRGEDVSGKGIYFALVDAFWDGGDDTKQDAKKEASLALLEAGIKGIKYADRLSRGKLQQTYNYVIFDENDIKITEFADESTGGEWKDYSDPTATFSIIGEKAESFLDYHNNGLSYTDPADGKRKAIIDSRGVRLKKERMGVSEGGHVNVSLAAALDFPELFRAYPELRKLRVDFYRDSKSNTGGFTDPRENYIAVNLARGGKNAAPGMVLDTILHEVQHVIQGYEGFALGAGGMNRKQALAYLGESMKQLKGRDDDWAKKALPRLERMKRELEEGTLQPPFVYIFSHGEQEARLAGSFNRNSEGVVMSGLNGFRLLEAPMFSIPLTGNITELGGITFGAGRFGPQGSGSERGLALRRDGVQDAGRYAAVCE